MIVRMESPILDVDSVSKRYGTRPALQSVSFQVAPGEVFGLLGPNGAGKTTLMSILAGLIPPDAGVIRFNGEPFILRNRAQRHFVGIGTQDLAVYPDLTARENLEFFGRLYGLRGKPLQARVSELLAAVGLTERSDHRAGTFSGGMKRRLNLAVAVVHRPALLLLDEPTTGVDPQSRNHIFEMVRHLNAQGMTIVYTSHYMEEVEALCPRIAILDHGQIIACEAITSLLQHIDTTIKLVIDNAPEGLATQLRALPGVKEVLATSDGFSLVASSLDEILRPLAQVCQHAGVQPLTVVTNEPSLEKAFLQLTGRALRD